MAGESNVLGGLALAVAAGAGAFLLGRVLTGEADPTDVRDRASQLVPAPGGPSVVVIPERRTPDAATNRQETPTREATTEDRNPDTATSGAGHSEPAPSSPDTSAIFEEAEKTGSTVMFRSGGSGSGSDRFHRIENIGGMAGARGL